MFDANGVVGNTRPRAAVSLVGVKQHQTLAHSEHPIIFDDRAPLLSLLAVPSATNTTSENRGKLSGTSPATAQRTTVEAFPDKTPGTTQEIPQEQARERPGIKTENNSSYNSRHSSINFAALGNV